MAFEVINFLGGKRSKF